MQEFNGNNMPVGMVEHFDEMKDLLTAVDNLPEEHGAIVYEENKEPVIITAKQRRRIKKLNVLGSRNWNK